MVSQTSLSGYAAVGNANPFRYRGYYWDAETGFYYLQSRYYDPVIGRFINADGYVNANGDLIGYNMYAYCGNNPVMCVNSLYDVPGKYRNKVKDLNFIFKNLDSYKKMAKNCLAMRFLRCLRQLQAE